MVSEALTNGNPQSNGHVTAAHIPPSSNWIVQKFGGTSVGKFPEDIIFKAIKLVAIAAGAEAARCGVVLTHPQTKSC